MDFEFPVTLKNGADAVAYVTCRPAISDGRIVIYDFCMMLQVFSSPSDPEGVSYFEKTYPYPQEWDDLYAKFLEQVMDKEELLEDMTFKRGGVDDDYS